jgi:hypothetical protein
LTRPAIARHSAAASAAAALGNGMGSIDDG